MLFEGRASLVQPALTLLLLFGTTVVLSSDLHANETDEVTSLLNQLFDESENCNTRSVDLGFLVEGNQDGTTKEKENAFTNAMEFVKKMARAVKISDTGTHVGLIVYGKKPSMAFDFNEYSDVPSMSEAIDRVKQPTDGHMTGQALAFVKDKLYEQSGRPGVPKALVVVVSKKSGDMVTQGAYALKKSGVKIYTVGIGPESDPLEMNDVASEIQDTFITDDNHLSSLVKKLVSKICADVARAGNDEDTETTYDDHESTMRPDQEPGPQKSETLTVGQTPTDPVRMVKPEPSTEPRVVQIPTKPVNLVKPEARTGAGKNKVDIVFLVQSSGKMGLYNWMRTVLFMKYVASAFDISKTETRLGIVTEGRTFHVVVDLNRILKQRLLVALLGLIPMPYGDQKIGKGLQDVTDLVLKPSGRPNVKDIVIVLTDDNSVDAVSGPVKTLLENGVEIFAVGLGDRVSYKQLESLASFPYSKHVLQGGFDKVAKLSSKVIAEIYRRHFCGGLKALLRKLLRRKVPRRKKISDAGNK